MHDRKLNTAEEKLDLTPHKQILYTLLLHPRHQHRLPAVHHVGQLLAVPGLHLTVLHHHQEPHPLPPPVLLLELLHHPYHLPELYATLPVWSQL